MVRVGNNVSTCYSSGTRRVILAFNKLRETISEIHGVDLPETRLVRGGELDVPAIKEFCGGLLSRGTPHSWRAPLSRLSARSRLSVAGSLFLFRKVLPSPDPSLDDYADKMSEPGPPSDPDFIRFCRREVSRLFPYGWDRRYSDRCIRSYLPSTSCLESGTQQGGCRALGLEEAAWMDRLEFCEYVLTAVAPRRLAPSRVVSVETGGKKRIVSVPSIDMNCLRPFHSIFYDRISREPWLLRGEAGLNRFRAFHRVAGEVFVSGDYESATDNLNQDTQIKILRMILRKCSHVPVGILDMAESSLRMELAVGKRVVRQARGQLMGNLVSFPLLCLVNYLAFKYAVPRDVPVMINGDDIVFRCRTEEKDRWMRQVGRSGLVLSHGKTMIDSRFFSLNSQWFEGTRSGVKNVPVVRSTAMGWVSRGESCSLLGRLRACVSPGFGKEKRERAIIAFLKFNSGLIHATNRSVTRGLGAWFVSYNALVESGLWSREHFYLSLESEHPLPPPVKDLSWDARVPGWRLINCPKSEKVSDWQREYEALQIESLWSTPPSKKSDTVKSYREQVKDGTFAYDSWLSERKSQGRRWRRLARLSACAFKQYMRPRRSVYELRVRAPDKKRWFWIPEDVAAVRNIFFMSSGFIAEQ